MHRAPADVLNAAVRSVHPPGNLHGCLSPLVTCWLALSASTSTVLSNSPPYSPGPPLVTIPPLVPPTLTRCMAAAQYTTVNGTARWNPSIHLHCCSSSAIPYALAVCMPCLFNAIASFDIVLRPRLCCSILRMYGCYEGHPAAASLLACMPPQICTPIMQLPQRVTHVPTHQMTCRTCPEQSAP